MSEVDKTARLEKAPRCLALMKPAHLIRKPWNGQVKMDNFSSGHSRFVD